jgi:uracil-DNA glycosylase family 4
MNRADRRAELSALHRRMRRCRRCLALGQTITPPAIFTGDVGARILLVGQAPGIHELKAGRPFHAQSGTRLFQWLAEAGFQEATFRATQYMTSVTKCFPGKALSGGGDRKPTAAEIEACLPFLQAQVALIDPSLVIPVGRLAMDVFFSDGPALEAVIGTRRRQDGRTFVPLPHPSGASRWHQTESNRDRIARAIHLLSLERKRLGL